MAFCTAGLKASMKKSREPLKMTWALYLAQSPEIGRVLFPMYGGTGLFGKVEEVEEPVRTSKTKGLPPFQLFGREWVPSMVGAFSRFSVSATLSVCWLKSQTL